MTGLGGSVSLGGLNSHATSKKPIKTRIKNSGNYIPNIMKRMAPYSNNDLPKGTKYFIRKHQLIRSTGIELEDDGQMVKLHPDLNGSDAHLYPEYPLKMYLEDIKLEIYLNSTISSQWSSKGSAKFCLSRICTKVFIDDTSTFSGIFSELPTKYIFENLSPSVEHLNIFTTLTNVSVIGTLVDSYNSQVVINGNMLMNQDYKCNESFSISRKTPVHFFDSINETIIFDSTFIISQNCFNVLPSKVLKIFVSPTLLNYDKLEKITSESILMNKNAFCVLIEHQFKKKCYYKNDYSICNEEKISDPDLHVSVWVESDSNYDEPTIQIKINDLITEIKSKKLSSLTNQFFEKISSESRQKNESLKNTMNMLNLTEAKKISINSDKNEFFIHFNSSDHENPCLSVGDLAVCDWQAVLRLFKTQNFDEKCSEINITGNGKALFEKSNFGSVAIKIKQSCNGENNFSMRVNINEITVYKIFEYIGKNINMNDDLLKIFDSRNFENLKSLQSERISNSLDEFLSEKIPNIIKGYTWIPGLNSTIPFALNVNSKEKTEKAFKNLCLFLNQNSTLKFISKLTSLEQNLLPSILEDSSVCIQPKKNSSITKHDVHIRLPINIMSKCFTTDLLCPFLNIVIGEKWEGVLFEGIVKDTSLNLKSPVTPIGDFFNHFNLHNCFMKYKIKNKEDISVYMKCRIYFAEIGYNISIFFVPFYKEEELIIMSFIKHTNKSYPKLFGIDQFRYRNINAKFLLKKKMKTITLKLDVYYSEFGISSSSQPPTAYLHIDLKNKNNSLVHLIIPPYSITDISKILGFGECPALLPIITDTLEEWELRVVGLPFNSNQSILSIYGLNLVQNSLFNSTIQVSNKIQQSKIILRGVKPIIIPINHTNEQAVFNSYSDINQGPSIVLNMECACENICEEDKIGDIISDIDILGISNAIKINIIDKLIQFEKELDTILHVLNKIRSDKIDVQLKLDEIKKKLEEDTTIEIVYQTSLNLTCREEICDRICVGCATSLSCAIKDILGSCVSLPNWDMKCGCSRDPLCLLYNDACDEIIEMSKTQLKIYDNTKNIQKSLYESYIKNYEDISRDEAKTELLYSTAMRITLKTIKEMRHKLNEANQVQKDIPIIKWLKVYDIQISLFENINETNNDTKTTNLMKNLCIFLKIHYNNRKSKTIRKIIKYCPYIDESLIDHVVYKISKDLFPQLCDVLIDEKPQPTQGIKLIEK
ncbi:hypothetical protein MXB_2889 [Myxobolus squamalis]|nr:hypothetical protein MXB_2889 [Myxobolus squamalis]